jgi:hypothetical protein
MIKKSLSLLALLLLAQFASMLHAAETIEPVGYVMGFIEGEEQAEPKSFCVRGEKQLPLANGFEIQPGDSIVTAAKESAVVIFLDGNTVHLGDSSRMKVKSYEYPAKLVPSELGLEKGTAYFSVAKRPEEAPLIVETRSARSISCGTFPLPIGFGGIGGGGGGGGGGGKSVCFSVFVNSANGTDCQATISVSTGTVSVKPASPTTSPLPGTGTSIFDIAATQTALLTVDTTNVVGGQTQTINKGNLTKAQIAALAANVIERADVCKAKDGTVTIQYTVKNLDGTIERIKRVEKNGVVITESEILTQGKTVLDAETLNAKNRANVTRTIKQIDPSGRKIIVLFTKSSKTGTVTITDGKTKYTGVATLTGMQFGTLQLDTTAKSGARLVVNEKLNPDGSVTKTTTTFAPGATQGSQTQITAQRDGSTTTTTSAVTTMKDVNGNFVTASGTTPTTTTTASKGNPPCILSTGAAALPQLGEIVLENPVSQ